ncbi:MAG: hypothetical protein JWO68_3630, partial [Actinomycetia bacterium]|nr:hypothetical protein [Actinomycetes bacterium]
MDLNHYVFRSAWTLDAPPAAVYAALEAVGDYPAWWPEIRRAEQVGDASFTFTCRSTLPYDLVFTSSQSRHDPEAGVLEAVLTGDL